MNKTKLIKILLEALVINLTVASVTNEKYALITSISNYNFHGDYNQYSSLPLYR